MQLGGHALLPESQVFDQEKVEDDLLPAFDNSVKNTYCLLLVPIDDVSIQFRLRCAEEHHRQSIHVVFEL